MCFLITFLCEISDLSLDPFSIINQKTTGFTGLKGIRIMADKEVEKRERFEVINLEQNKDTYIFENTHESLYS